MGPVYITKTASLLPNSAVTNDEMEDFLGIINNKSSRSKAMVLRNNKIKQRYYALKKGGETTHSNAQLTSFAIKNLFDNNLKLIKEVDLLCCGTSSPDQIMPSHGLMVHGCLPEMKSIEVITPSGNCCAGMHALKYAYLSLSSGDKNKAVCAGSERISQMLKSQYFEQEINYLNDLKSDAYLSFEKDFLRWMLSDGAGAFLLENKCPVDKQSLKIEWIETVSFANTEETCMYMGAEKMKDGTLKGFSEYSPQDVADQSILSIKQDSKLLSNKIIELGFNKIPDIFKKHNITGEEIDYFLVHMSSYFFEDKIAQYFEKIGINLPKEKWFNTLSKIGNVGAGSIYLMVDELMKSGNLKKGNRLLLIVPESARFSYAYSLLTVC